MKDQPNGKTENQTQNTNPDEYVFGGIKDYNLEQIETEALVESSYFYLDVFAGSDLRLKKNIQPIDGALDRVMQLHGITYEWDEAQFQGKAPDSKRHAGLIAQEVAKAMPELAGQEPKSGHLGVDYAKVTSYLIEAIKELNERVRTLEARGQNNLH